MNLADFADRSRRVIFVSLVFLLYLGVFVWLDFLGFDPQRDEVHFWPTSLGFSHSLLPTLDQLRNYDELNTPLPFMLFGWLEYFFGLGIFAGRLLNMFLSFSIVLVVGMPRGESDEFGASFQYREDCRHQAEGCDGLGQPLAGPGPRGGGGLQYLQLEHAVGQPHAD